MTVEADRADALEAALRDVARDLEADLSKLRRYRGTKTPGASGPTFQDPGPDLANYEKQKAAFPGRVEHTISTYRPALGHARSAIHNGTTSDRRAGLLSLLAAIQNIRNLDEAAALVATFQEA